MAETTNTPPENSATPAVREFNFDQPVVNVGSHPDNDLTIAGGGVMPFHASFVRKNGLIDVVALAPEANILLEGDPIQATSASLKENQRIDLGEYAIYVQVGATPLGMHLTVYKGTQTGIDTQIDSPQAAASSDGEQSILVNVLSQQSEVEVEQSALYEFEIVNAGQIVAGFHVAIQGVPNDWVTITPRLVNLNEGQRAIVRASITPPRAPTSTAGKHALNLVVTSPNYPRSRSVTQIDLTIAPFYDFQVGNLDPRQQHIHWRDSKGNVSLPIKNQGNNTTNFSVMALDEENGCTFDFVVGEDSRLTRQAAVNIEAGESHNLPIEIIPNRKPVIAFRSRRYHYSTTLQVAGQAVAPQTVSGSVVSHPLLGWWAILLSAFMVVLGIFFLIQPRINSYQVAAGKDLIELGDSTALEWSVSPFATRLSISNIDKEVNRSMKHITVAPTQSTTYELVAGNWISGLLGMDRRQSITVLVVPPTPKIAVFDVDKTAVDKGIPVNIRWSVTKADKVLLTIDDVVTELPEDQFSGQQEVNLEEDAIVTLEASNLSGTEMRSFFVNVVPPHIDVKKFTVWVKTNEGSSTSTSTTTAAVTPQTSSGAAHTAAIVSAGPQPRPAAQGNDFPYKFVELTEDKNSETGYRVQFYQSNRELDKGEQVMLEWEIDGVENVAIAPFTETLPAKGKQPYFPQESMNFVLTAKSGELEQIFMLPVNVFTGEPPTAPTIDFFKAVPAKMVGSGDVQFSWSVSKAWTHIQLAKGGDEGEEVVADWINPQGFKTVTVEESGTFLLKAWNGELSTASPVDITVDPDLIKIALNIVDVYTDAGRFMVGQKVTVTIGFDKVPSDKPKPTGKVTVTDGYSSCSITLPALSCDLTFNTPGDKEITASYEGDTIYLQDDSPPYAQTITVQSAEVEMVPRYYELESGSDITDITDPATDLDMDEGLRIMVEVRPKNVSIPDDGKSKVNVSICDQDAAGELIDGTCSFIGGATATVATEETFSRTIGSFYADISVTRFNVSGKHLLLFDYFHDDGEIDPTSYEQPNVTIGLVKFFLNSSMCETDPDTLSGCKLGTQDPASAQVTLGFRVVDPNDDLQSTLPLPPASAFTFNAVGQPGAGATTWSCDVKTVSGVYKLVCDVTGLDPLYNPWDVTYTFDNSIGGSYYMENQEAPDIKTKTFQMDVLQNTKIIFDDVSAIKVGQVINLTGPSGIASLQDATGTEISGSIILEEKEGNSLSVFTCSSSVNCQQNSSTGAITIVDGTADSSVVFKKAGSITVKATYEGSAGTYVETSSEKTLVITKQDEITAAWFSEYGSTAWPTSLVVNRQLDGRIVLDIPTSGYDDKSLVGRDLLVKFLGTSGISNCSIGAPGTGTAGEYLVTIEWDAATSSPIADFAMTCSSASGTLPYDVEMELGFTNVGEDMTGDDLAFTSSATTIEDLTIQENSSTYMTVVIKRMPDSAAGHDNMVHTSPNTIDWFHVGEKYMVQVTISRIYEYYNSWGATYTSNGQIINDYTANNIVKIILPASVESAIDWSQSTCGAQNDVKVRLNRAINVDLYDDWDRKWNWLGVHWDYYYWGGSFFDLTSDPCYLVFKPDVTVNQNTTFSFTSHNSIYKATGAYTTPGIAKQDVSMTFTPTGPYSGYVGMPQIITINLASITNTDTTLKPIASSVTDFNTQFTASTTCGTITDKKINSSNQAQLTLSSDTECTDKKLTVSYIQNDYFNPLTNQEYTFTLAKHTPSATLQYDGGTGWVSFPFSATNKMPTKKDHNLRVKLTDSLGHSFIPQGNVGIKPSIGTYFIKDSIGNTVAPSADGYCYISLDSNGYGEFFINFDGAVTGTRIQYSYPGSQTFLALSSESPIFDVVAP